MLEVQINVCVCVCNKTLTMSKIIGFKINCVFYHMQSVTQLFTLAAVTGIAAANFSMNAIQQQ